MGKRIKSIMSVFLMVFVSLATLVTDNIEARAEGGVVIKLHYNRPDGKYDGWDVWFWESGKDGAGYAFAEEDGDMVATMEATPGTMEVGFIVRTENWDKDVAEDQFIDISEMVSGTVHVYVESTVKGYEKKYGDDAVKGTKLKTAAYQDDGTILIEMTGDIAYDYKDAFEVSDKDGSIKVLDVTQPKEYYYSLKLEKELNAFRNYTLKFEGQGYKVIMPNVYSTEGFEKEYTYEGSDLGAVYSKEQTTFKVWAPTADSVSVRTYESGDARIKNLIEEIPMTKGDKGVYEAVKAGDLNGVYYTYAVTIDGVTKEAVDPYTRTTGLNGERGMVIDLDATDPAGWDEDVNPHAGERINDAIIYEAHIRDLTVEDGAGIENVGKFIGVAEAGTQTESGIPTGMEHIKDLGVTHLHILPFYDFGSVDELKVTSNRYNWGYDPVNYNVPEGSYSTDAADGAVRVKEAKEMIKALHDNGISVVMDVVYNHVYSASDFCFNKIVPNYFSRTTESGAFSNGSGCGNDTATERSMVRKYIVDSVCYWADEYHIDGFRFDLVGLMDVDTINMIVEEVHKTHPDVIFYGEGWSMSTTVTKENVELATQKNSSLTPEFSFFNDTIRDGLKGSVFNTGVGFVSGSAGDDPKISRCFFGLDNWCDTPSQTINYASCHDNNTLYDRLRVSLPDAKDEDIVAMNKLAAVIYMTSQGTPFMQAGEEILRTKTNADGTYNSNSYSSGDEVNTIEYSSLSDATVANVYEYYKGLISFRKAHAALRMDNADDVNKYISEIRTGVDHLLTFEIDGSYEPEISDRLFFAFNASFEEQTVTLPEGEWNVCINSEKAGTEVIETAIDSIKVPASSAVVLVQGETSVKEDISLPVVSETSDDNKTGLIAALISVLVLIIAAVVVFFKKN